MNNKLLTIDMITRLAVRLWKNENSFIRGIDMQYDDQYAVNGAKIGSNLRVRPPNDFTVRTGSAISFQHVSENFTTLPLATQNNVALSFSQAQQVLQVDDYAE